MIFYDDKGLKMREPEVTTMDNIVCQCGGYSLLNDETLSLEYVYAAHHKNIDIFHNHPFGLVKIGRPIDENSENY